MDVIAGLTAGATATLITHPLDVVKIKLQLGGTPTSSNLYRGITPNLVGNAIAWGSYYGLYNQLQKRLENNLNGPLLYWTSSFTAGVSTSFVTNPIWVIKTRMVGSSGERYQTTLKTIYDIAKRDGVSGFWRGFPLSLAGTLQASLHFMIYDSLKPWFMDEWTPSIKYLATSAVSKTIAATLMYPHQVIRSRMQYNDTAFTPTVTAIYRKTGLTGFYRGILPALLRVVPAMCINQVIYEKVMNI